MSKQFRNTYIDGMDKDSSKSKYSNTRYLRGSNIKLITEDGLSTGNIENEDGNKFLFKLPTIYPVYRIYYTDIENPVLDTLSITYIDPITNISTNVNCIGTSLEDLFESISANLNPLIEAKKIKLIHSISHITLVLYDEYVNIFNSLQSTNHITVEQILDKLSNLKIIGGAYLREEIVIFSTSSDDETPSGTDGQIWKFAFNNNITDIENINGSKLDSYYHLIYNGKLNFSTYWHIGREAIGHYENSKTGRVYWTDEYNQLRTANLLDPNLLGVLPNTFNIMSNYNTSLPVIKNFGTGSVMGGSVVQYCYRLAKTGGQYTSVSPLTNPCPLLNTNHVGNDNFLQRWGAQPGVYGHSITYEITGIDTNYNVIEHIAVVTENNNLSIYIFKIESVPQDGNLIVIHSDKGENIPLTVEEFSFINRGFKRCKTITIKDKRLIAANLDMLDTIVDNFDVRAYRFNPARLSKITDNERTDIDFNGVDFKYTNNASLDWTDIPKDYDAINPYNKNSSSNYRFQADGITLGGEGPNVKYKFSIRNFEAKDRINGLDGLAAGKGEGYIVAGSRRIHTGDVSGHILNGKEVLVPGEFFTYKSASVCVNFTGYSRGETYRFGVTFFDKAGNPFNTKWIGDIKFPEHLDYQTNSANNFGLGFTTNNKIYSKILGIDFDINISDIKDYISGFEIVRVRRTISNRTRLGTGILVPFTDGVTNPVPNKSRYNLDGYTTLEKSYLSSSDKKYFALADHPAIQGTYIKENTSRMYAFISPITTSNQFIYEFNIQDKDRVKTIDFQNYIYQGGKNYFNVNNRTNNGSGDYPERGTIANEICLPNQQDGNLIINNPNYVESKKVTKGTVLDPATMLNPATFPGMMPGFHYFNGCSVAFKGSGDTDVGFSGFGERKAILELENNFKYFDGNGTEAGASNQHMITQWRMVSYERDLISQYGGNTFESRSSNEYISTGSFKFIKETSQDVHTIQVYGGDVYVQYYPHNYFYHAYTQNASGIGIDAGQNGNQRVGRSRYNLGVGFLCESPLNVEIQSNFNYSSNIYKDWFAGVLGNALFYLQGPRTTYMFTQYRKQNDSKLIHFAKGFLDDFVDEFPHRIWASDKKIDGELFDNWKLFRPNNFAEVEGMYGEINKIITERDDLLFYQDTALGKFSLNDRTTIPSSDGTVLVLGKGGILDYYNYLSRRTGTKHKFSVVPSSTGIHHYDSNLKKWFLLKEGINPLNDIKGLNSVFKEFDGNLIFDDRLLKRNGVHGIYDRVRNKVYMTFLNTRYSVTNSGLFIPPIEEATPPRESGSIGTSTGSTDPISENINVLQPQPGSNIDYTNITPVPKDNLSNIDYTISYNELLEKFESEHDFKPSLYLENSGHLLSTSEDNLSLWEHYKGLKNSYYGDEYVSTLELIVNPDGDITKIFDGIEFKSEMYINDIDSFNNSIDNIQILNDHQDSGVIPLIVDGNLKRKFRTWRLNVFRDKTNSSREPRIRDYYMKIILKHIPKYTVYTVNNVGTMTNPNRITLNIPNIGTLKNLKGSMITLSGSFIIQSPNSAYNFNGKYLILDYNANSITIELPTPIIGTVNFQQTNNVVAIINDDRKLILHDIITNYRYSPH